MPAYVISYDLRHVRNYEPLLKQLRDWNCISPLQSVWLGQLSGTSAVVRDLLRGHMDNDDGMIVIEIKPTTDWAVVGVSSGTPGWLRANLGG